MPIIEGADMASVETSREPWAEGEYLFTIKQSNLSDDKRFLIVDHVCEEGPDSNKVGKVWQNWINLRQNDGKMNEIGLSQIKRYKETIYGKGSPESNSNDTDDLNGHQVRVVLVVKSWQKDGEEQKGNNIKKMFRA